MNMFLTWSYFDGDAPEEDKQKLKVKSEEEEEEIFQGHKETNSKSQR